MSWLELSQSHLTAIFDKQAVSTAIFEQLQSSKIAVPRLAILQSSARGVDRGTPTTRPHPAIDPRKKLLGLGSGVR